MDTRDGRIYSDEQRAAMSKEDRRYLIRMTHEPTPLQKSLGRVGRNDPCPCGSGKKFKKCHLLLGVRA
jgi:uncharacterized protein YecA (UPF0149 family)